MKLLILYGKNDPVHYHFKSEAELYSLCKKILKERLKEGYYEDDPEFKAAVTEVIKPGYKSKNPLVYWNMLHSRHIMEYEDVRIVETVN